MNINEVNIKTVEFCPCCNTSMKAVINLPKFPLTEFYEDYDDSVFENKGFLDQNLLFCDSCCHASLEKIIDVDYIYSDSNYLTTTAGSYGAIQCLDNFYEFIKSNTKDLNLKNVIDVGGNDGYLLNLFPDNLSKINIDPNAKKADGIIDFKMFFEKLDFDALNKFENKLIVSSHTFEHVSDPVKLIGEISDLLKNDEMFIMQLPSIEKLVEHKKYEQLTHQHLNYFSKNSIYKVFSSFGLEVNDIGYDETHFGTIRVAATKKNTRKVQTQKFEHITAREIEKSFEQYKTYMNVINENIKSSKAIYGFGAGLMVPVLSYFLPALKSLICIYDENEFKHGKRFINLNVPITNLPNKQDFLLQDVVITSVTTRSAARSIFKKLIDLKAKNIILPAMFL